LRDRIAFFRRRLCFATAGDRDHAQPQLLRRAPGSLAKIAEAYDNRGLAGDRGREDHFPRAIALVLQHLREAHVEREYGERAGILGFRPVRASIVGERDVRRQPVQRHELIDTGPGRLNPFQARRTLGEPLLRRKLIDHEVGRFERFLQDLVVPANRDAQALSELRMAFRRGGPECLGELQMLGARAARLEVKVERHLIFLERS
jgi:hypothetical protein